MNLQISSSFLLPLKTSISKDLEELEPCSNLEKNYIVKATDRVLNIRVRKVAWNQT